MNVVDSSAWLEYFAQGSNSHHFITPIQDRAALLVPTIVIYEVFKRIYRQTDEGSALRAVVTMRQGQLVDVDTEIALRAAKRSADLKLPMADALIYSITEIYEGTLWTQDNHFATLPHVRYFAK